MHKHNVYLERTKLIINSMYTHCTAQTTAGQEPRPSPSLSIKYNYRIAGNFRVMQNFVILRIGQLSQK